MNYSDHLKDNLETACMHLGYFFRFLLHALCPLLYKKYFHAEKMWRYALAFNERDGMLYPQSLMIRSDGVTAELEFMEGESEWLRNSLSPHAPDTTENYPEEVFDFKNYHRDLLGRYSRRSSVLLFHRSYSS